MTSGDQSGPGHVPPPGPNPRDIVWNFSFGVADGAFFGLFLVLADVNLILPWLLSQLTDARWVIGLPPILTIVGASLPQILAAHTIQKYPLRKRMILSFASIRLGLFALILPFLFWPIGGAELTLIGVLVPYALSCLVVSFSALAWQDMVAKVIPGRRLSSFFGTRTLVAGFLGLGGSWFVGSYLGAVQIVPLEKFGVILGLALVSISLAVGTNALVREAPSPVPARQQTLRSLIAEAARLCWGTGRFGTTWSPELC